VSDMPGELLRFIRKPEEQVLIAGEPIDVLRVALGGSRAVGFYFVFRGDPEEVIELAEMMVAAARPVLREGRYLDERGKP
jgi:hypothetical protein